MYKKLIYPAIIVILLTFQAVSAQSEDAIIVEGPPALKQSDIDKSLDVLEKILDLKFAPDERVSFRYYALDDWQAQDGRVIKAIQNLVRLHNQINRLNEAEQTQLREKTVADIEDAGTSEVRRFLLETYNRAHGKNNDAQNISTSSSENRAVNNESEDRHVQVLKNGGTIGDLVGKWERKTSGMSSYSGGNYQGSSGNYESYAFFADGRAEYTTLIAAQNYGCRLEAFAQSKGRASSSGTALNIRLAAGTIRRDDSCSPSKNYTKPTAATNDTYEWRIEKDAYGNIQLTLKDADGKTFYYRKAN